MKKLITLILVLSTWNSFAQLTLVHETDKNLEPFMLTNGEWMFAKVELTKTWTKSIEKISFYKSDLSLYKTILIPQKYPMDTTGFFRKQIGLEYTSGKYFSSVLFFSDKFFNNDGKIEFMISYTLDSPYSDSIKSKKVTLILNEDGEEIHKFTSLKSSFMTFEFWKHLNVKFESITQIYSIPGNLPCPSSCNQKPASISPIDPSNAVNKLSIEGFPNPSSEKITLAYTLPKGSPYGTIRLYSQSGTLVKEFKVSDQFDHLELPVADYAAGTYFYELQVDGNSSGGKKMLVVH